MIWLQCLVKSAILYQNNTTMDEELFELAKENDLTLDEAQEVQDLADELGLDLNEALEVWQEQ